MKEKKLFFDFLSEYIDFYEQVENRSRERFEIISSYNLADLERSIANDQSSIMRAEQMEKRRIELQKEAGYGLMPLREIVNSHEGEEKEHLRSFFNRLSELLENIRFYNARCKKLVEANLYRIEKSAERANKPPSVDLPPLPENELKNIRLDGKA